MDSPFQYGSLATGKTFIDREKDRADLKQMLSSGIHVALISPRRWGKSSLVKMAMDELSKQRGDIRVCHIDAFSVNSEMEFYNLFASRVIACAESKMKKALEDAKKYLGGLSAGISLGDGLGEMLSVKLGYKPQGMDRDEILGLPQKIAEDKKIRIIVCIDEFQQLALLPEYAAMEGKMRSAWQRQSRVSYCLYGSKKHMMLDIFADSQKPFYRFAQVVFLPKIPKADWIPFIQKGFHDTGKEISEAFAAKICDTVDCHSWYVQQFAFFTWSATEHTVTESILSTALQRLIDTNSPMFISDTEKLTPSQKEMLRAISDGQSKLSSAQVKENYPLGNPNTIVRNKKALIEKSFIDIEDGRLFISDPVFRLWLRQS